MNAPVPVPMAAPQPAEAILKLAILAIGGQGGGVLSDWIVDVAERENFYAQSTSVPGVAQRTGATIYYIEMIPDRGDTPVLSLMPTPGDVDVVIAAEWMEAGRAIQRGLVTPDRTTLIASTHRAFAVGEKTVPGDGIADSTVVDSVAARAAKRLLADDMERHAKAAGSVISASLLGALAGSGALPFRRESYEAAIRAEGRGTDASLRAFAAGFDSVTAPSPPTPLPASARRADDPALGPGTEPAPTPPPPLAPQGPAALEAEWTALVARIAAELPLEAHAMARAGLAKVVDFQDCAYGAEYLDILARVAAADRATVDRAAEQSGGAAGAGHALTTEAAKHLANAMAYDDVIRVADRKTRSGRFRRIRGELGQTDAQVLHLVEYFHPRIDEVCGLLPARLGRAVEARPRLKAALGRIVDRGRRVRSDGLLGFGALYAVGALRRTRRGTLRHAREVEHRDAWLATALRLAERNRPLAVEVLKTRRLVKGYSDTHARGLSKFDRVLSALPLLEERADGADWLRRLRDAALKDEDGVLLDGALRTVASL